MNVRASRFLPRRSTVVGLLVLAGGVFTTFAASRFTGPAFDELGRVAVIARATELARAVTDVGPAAMVSSSARGIYQDLTPCGVGPALLSGWLGEVFAHAHLLDRLTADRLGWILPASLAPFWIYLVVAASRGPAIGALAACLLLGTPRWLHAAAVGRDGAFIAGIWLALIATYVRSISPGRAARRAGRAWSFRRGAIAFAFVLGVSLALSMSALWILLLIVLHFAIRSGKRSFRAVLRGRIPIPAALLSGLFIAPCIFLVGSPTLWQGDAGDALGWLFSPLAPSVEPLVYRGAAVTVETIPSGYSSLFLVATTPAWSLALAALGMVVLVANRRAAGPTGRRDPVAFGTLAVLVLAAVLLGPAATPRVLAVFPPRVELALPFIAALAAVGAGWLLDACTAGFARVLLFDAIALAAMVPAFAGIRTASASFGLLSGGTRGAQASRALAVGDGSEVAALAGAIDAFGAARIAIAAPNVPRNYFAALNQLGIMNTVVDGSRGSQADLFLTAGPAKHPVWTVERDASVLWSLSRR